MFMPFLKCHLDSKDSIIATPLLHEAIMFFEAFWLSDLFLNPDGHNGAQNFERRLNQHDTSQIVENF
jgi:hypothetical protein